MGIYDNKIRCMEQSMKMTGYEFTKLYVKNGKILPNDVQEIDGSLYLSNNNITKIENLPHTINNHLFLSNNRITKIENLPSIINGLVTLSNNPIYAQFKKSNYTDVKEWVYMIMKLDTWSKL